MRIKKQKARSVLGLDCSGYLTEIGSYCCCDYYSTATLGGSS